MSIGFAKKIFAANIGDNTQMIFKFVHSEHKAIGWPAMNVAVIFLSLLDTN